MTQRHFADGTVTRKALKRAQLAARQQLETVEAAVRRAGYVAAVGASGTIRALGAALAEAGFAPDGVITAKGLRLLEDRLCELGDAREFAKLGFSVDRSQVAAGGYAVLAAVFEALQLERLTVAGGALREGLLLDLVGRLRHTEVDVRDRSIAAFSDRFRVDRGHAARVRATALGLLDQAAGSWQLAGPQIAELLGWAADLSEVGLAVAHTQYHKHGAYVVEHADLAGFSREEQRLLAALVRAHRRKLPIEVFDALRAPWDRWALRAAVLLRLAVLLHRARDGEHLPALRCMAHAKRIELAFPAGWLDANPLTAADLEEEAGYLRAAEIELAWH